MSFDNEVKTRLCRASWLFEHAIAGSKLCGRIRNNVLDHPGLILDIHRFLLANDNLYRRADDTFPLSAYTYQFEWVPNMVSPGRHFPVTFA